MGKAVAKGFSGAPTLPKLFAPDQAAARFIEFFTANIRNPNTRCAYARRRGIRSLGHGALQPNDPERTWLYPVVISYRGSVTNLTGENGATSRRPLDVQLVETHLKPS